MSYHIHKIWHERAKPKIKKLKKWKNKNVLKFKENDQIKISQEKWKQEVDSYTQKLF